MYTLQKTKLLPHLDFQQTADRQVSVALFICVTFWFTVSVLLNFVVEFENVDKGSYLTSIVICIAYLHKVVIIRYVYRICV